MHTPHLAATCPVCGTGPYEARDACPLHKAAPKLLEALEVIGRQSARAACAYAEAEGEGSQWLAFLPEIARDAIREAKEK